METKFRSFAPHRPDGTIGTCAVASQREEPIQMRRREKSWLAPMLCGQPRDQADNPATEFRDVALLLSARSSSSSSLFSIQKPSQSENSTRELGLVENHLRLNLRTFLLIEHEMMSFLSTLTFHVRQLVLCAGSSLFRRC